MSGPEFGAMCVCGHRAAFHNADGCTSFHEKEVAFSDCHCKAFVAKKSSLSPVQEEATRPDCKSVLSRIVRPEGNTLSDEAFSREYGDWRCDKCPPNNATWHHYRVFWNARTEPHD